MSEIVYRRLLFIENLFFITEILRIHAYPTTGGTLAAERSARCPLDCMFGNPSSII